MIMSKNFNYFKNTYKLVSEKFINDTLNNSYINSLNVSDDVKFEMYEEIIVDEFLAIASEDKRFEKIYDTNEIINMLK